mgnify:CR=1 FL=1
MGKVLEMRLGAAFLGLLLLSGCSALNPPPPDLRGRLDPAAVAASQTPLLLAEIRTARAQATMRPVARNGKVVTWSSADDRMILLEQGILVGTRGLGFDLMSADPGETRMQINLGTGALYPRFYAHLDGEYQVVFSTLLCRIVDRSPETVSILGTQVATTRIEEGCRGPDRWITNIYWMTGNGTIRRSRQWIGAGLGYLQTERLKV